MKRKLTEACIPSLRTNKPQEDIFHPPTPGAGLRLTREGRKTWFLLYYSPDTGKKRRFYFGEHSSGKLGESRYLSLKEFEREYAIVRGDLAKGVDPQRKMAALPGTQLIPCESLSLDLQKLFPDGVIEGTVAALFVDFFQHCASKLKPRTYTNYKAAARTHVFPRFAKYPIPNFGEDEVNSLLSEVTKRSPQMVREVKKVISCAFAHGKAHVPGVKLNPALGIRVTVPKNSRDRWLTDNELETFFATLPKMEGKKAADIYMLVLASLCRPGEAASVKAEDLILINGERVWRIPDTKNGRDFLIPLEGPIGEILLRRSSEVGGKGPLFWKYNPGKGYPEALKKANKEFRMHSRLQNIRPHDLRRTGRTHMASLEIRDEVGEALMNHTKEDLKRTYNLWEYWQERKAALKLWHSKMEKIRSSLALAA